MRDFWLRSPIYIVLCVLLGFVIAGLLAQNVTLKDELEIIRKEQAETQATAEDVKQAADRLGNYLRCVSLTPVERRTQALIERCFGEDLPPQQQTTDPRQEPANIAPQPVENSSPAPVGNENTPNVTNGNPTPDPQPENEQPIPERGGLLSPITGPVCTNLTPRLCGTLGL